MVKPRENRVPIMMSEAELQSVDDWRYANRIATRSEAIRRLCQMGLLTGGKLEVLTEEMLEISNKLMVIDDRALNVWTALANPVTKDEKVDREAVANAVLPIIQDVDDVVAAIDEIAGVLMTLYAGATGLIQPDLDEGKRMTEISVKEINDNLERVRKLRADMIASRKEMEKYGYRKTDETGETE